MNHTIIDSFGILASLTSVLGFIPQIYRLHQTQSAEDLSFLMLINFVICSAAWIVYGYYTEAGYVVVTNCLSLVASFILCGQKIFYRR